LADYVGVSLSQVPAVMLVESKGDDVFKYKLSDEITVENLVNHYE